MEKVRFPQNIKFTPQLSLQIIYLITILTTESLAVLKFNGNFLSCLVQPEIFFNRGDFWKTNSWGGLQSCSANGQFKKSGMEIGLIQRRPTMTPFIRPQPFDRSGKRMCCQQGREGARNKSRRLQEDVQGKGKRKGRRLVNWRGYFTL